MEKKAKNPKKLSAKDAETLARALSEQLTYVRQENARLVKINQELNQVLAYRRLDYLFKVVENRSVFPAEFVTVCANEIEESLTPEKEEPKEEQE